MVTGSLFLGNDDNPQAYCVVSAKLPRTFDVDRNEWTEDPEYHIFDEMIGRLSEDFIYDIREFLHENKVERLIFVCSDEELRNRVRKDLRIRVIFEDEKKRNNNSVILREWFARTKKDGDDSQLKIWGVCSEAIKSNYPPARDCIVRLLEYYDKRKKSKSSVVRTSKMRDGYS
tara:strand:+ start:8858 stop:9376 length:519 start_codon:yes stop_codon:yes gene_type:complete